jgi:hypothetical protein
VKGKFILVEWGLPMAFLGFGVFLYILIFFLKEERNSIALGFGRNGLPNKRSSCFYNIPIVSS